MADIWIPTPEQVADWEKWVQARPPKVRECIEKHNIKPWKLYRLTTSGHRVTFYSVDEPHDGSPCTVKVDVTGDFNMVAFERRVFGVDPAHLVECDLPKADEPLGCVAVDPSEIEAAFARQDAAMSELAKDLKSKN